MRKRMTKLMVAASLIMSITVGCGKTGPSTGKVIDTNTGVFNEFGWEVPEETLVINILNAGGFSSPTEAEKQGQENTKKYYKEKFNIDLQIESVSGDGQEAVNLALASNDYPDIITNITYDTMTKFASMGKAQDLTPYMDTIGKDIKASMDDLYPLFLDDEGKFWGTPTIMGSVSELPDNAAHLRYDEWQAIGSPEINTPDDFYNAVNKILEMNPTTPNGESRYALSLYSDSGHYTDPANLTGHWGLKKGYKIDEDNKLTHWAFTEEGKEMTKFLNRFYLDGTLDPDSFANNYDEWKTKFSNERIVGVLGAWWISYDSGHEVWNATDPDTPEDKRYIHFSFKDEEAETAYLSDKNSLGNRFTIITDKAKDVEALFKYINFQATEKGMALTTWGIPNGTEIGDTGELGMFWTIDEDGNWEVDPVAKEQLVNETWSYDNESYWQGAPWLFTNQSRWKDGVHNIWRNQMWYEENKWKTIMIDNMDGTIFDNSAMVLREKSDDTKITEQGVSDAWRMNWGAAVQAKDDATFDKAWQALQDALTTAGIDKLTDVLSENYINNLEKLGQ